MKKNNFNKENLSLFKIVNYLTKLYSKFNKLLILLTRYHIL
jgi:hypothetical protein